MYSRKLRQQKNLPAAGGRTNDLEVVQKCLYIIIEQCPITGPPLAGVIVDQTHSLRLPLVISTVVQGASTIMAGLTCVVNRGQNKGYLNMV